MDRPVRPLFPKGWFIDTQIIANVISFDKENATDVLAMTGASAALHISDLVWDGPLAGVRVGRIDGQFVANPTFAEREKSDMDIIVAASKDAIMMVEGEMHELQEDVDHRRPPVRAPGRAAADRAAGAPPRRATARRSARSRRPSPTRPWSRRSRRSLGSPRRGDDDQGQEEAHATASAALHTEIAPR